MSKRYVHATGKNNCGNCQYSHTIEYHDKTYRKCELMGDSRSPNTDVSRRKVCNAHKFKESAATVAQHAQVERCPHCNKRLESFEFRVHRCSGCDKCF